MIAALRLYATQVVLANRMALADRANFALQAGGMFINNAFMLVLWGLFFAGFKSVGGWRQGDMALLMGITMTVVGVSGVAFGGYRDMAATILRGELDALLTQPKGLMGRLLARECLATAWGDLIGGPLLLAGFARLSWGKAPLVVAGIAGGTVVYVSAGVCFASLAFWASGARSFARDLTDFTLVFSTYPGSIYRGAVKAIAFSILPAGFVVMAPVRMVRDASVETAAMVAGAAVLYAALAMALFHLGLSRYRRGASVAG